jgi:hypothetical protein
MAATTVALSSAAYHQTSKPFSAGLVGVQMTQPIATRFRSTAVTW